MKINKMFLLTIFIIFVLCLTGCNHNTLVLRRKAQIESGKNITIFVATDIHYLSKKLTDNGKAFNQYVDSGDGKQQNYIDEIVNAFANDIKNKKPDILILSGDLTNNGEKDSHEELAKKLKTIEKTGTQVFVIPGNHDIENPWARQFKGDNQYKADTVTAQDFSKIYGDFGYNEAVSKDSDSLSYLAEPSKNIWLLMLDTNEYENNEALGFPVANGKIRPETLQWIKKCSAMAKEQHAQIITVMHQNLLKHIDMFTDGYTIDNSSEAIKAFQDYGLSLVLSGHIHIQDIKSDTSRNTPIYEIVTSALSVYPQQYGVIKYSPSNGFDYITSKVDVEGWAKETGVTDKNLLNFKEYSKNFFAGHAYNMSYNHLLADENFTDEQKKQMADTMAIVNLNLFSGRENENIDEIINSPGYKLWKTANQNFSMNYITSVINNKSMDNNKLHIPFASSLK